MMPPHLCYIFASVLLRRARSRGSTIVSAFLIVSKAIPTQVYHVQNKNEDLSSSRNETPRICDAFGLAQVPARAVHAPD